MKNLGLSESIQKALRLTEAETRSKAIANVTGATVSTVNAWRSGQRSPTSAQAAVLAKYLFPKERDKQRWLIQELDTSRDPEKLTLLRELDENLRSLRIGSTSKQSYGRIGFLDQFIYRFFQLAGIRHKLVEGDEMVDLKEQIVDGRVDVGVGLFATLDRSLMVKFFPTPIRVGLNAVVLGTSLRRTEMSIAKLRNVIAPRVESGVRPPDLSIAPIVVATDVGGTYAAKTLGFPDAHLNFLSSHHYSAYGKRLLEEEEYSATEKLPQTPVAIVDDVTALYVLKYLDKERHGARLVFPLSDEEVAKEKKKWMPEYLVGLAVKRTNLELAEYLADALRLFLRTEVQMISTFYADVCVSFENMATETCTANRSWNVTELGALEDAPEGDNRRCSRAWVEYTFGLTSNQLKIHQDFELPWKPILINCQPIYEEQRVKGCGVSGSRP